MAWPLIISAAVSIIGKMMEKKPAAPQQAQAGGDLALKRLLEEQNKKLAALNKQQKDNRNLINQQTTQLAALNAQQKSPRNIPTVPKTS
jgi:hypothetical protein